MLVSMDSDADQRLAEAVRSLLVQRALSAYEDAAIRGLCQEGACEAALSALRQLDLAPVVAAHRAGAVSSPRGEPRR